MLFKAKRFLSFNITLLHKIMFIKGHGKLFNFFEGLKKEFKLGKEYFGKFNVVLVSNNFLYIEGHKGLLKLTQENVSFKVKGGAVVVKGSALTLKELTLNTVAISGNILSFEVI